MWCKPASTRYTLQHCQEHLVMSMDAACKHGFADSCQPPQCVCLSVPVCMTLPECTCLNVPMCLPGWGKKAQFSLKLCCLTAGRALEDGKGSLADGTQFDRQSGEEHGPNGYWFRWHRLKGKSGKVSGSKAQTPHIQCTFTILGLIRGANRL